MRWLILILSLLALTPTNARAETMYVSDIMEITLRTGPGRDNKIITMISSGQKVDVLRRAEKWSKIRMSNGKEGWVLNRFLTSEKSNLLKLKDLQGEFEKLKVESDPLHEEATRLKQENARLSSALADRVRENDALKKEVAILHENKETSRLIAGGGILLFGIILGMILGKRRRRTPSLR